MRDGPGRFRARWSRLGPALTGVVAAIGAFGAVASGWAAWRGVSWAQVGSATVSALVAGAFAYVQQTRGGHRGANALVAGGIAPTSTAPGQSLLPERPDLFQLPPDIGDFTGREAALAELLSLLKPDGAAGTALSLVVIAGKAGVGKTALAIHAAHQTADRVPDGQLYVNLRGVEPQAADPAYVLAQLLVGLGVRRALLPDGLEERARLYRARLHGRRVLVVLDNAASEAQVRPLLPGSASCAVLITSRSRLDGLAGSRILDLDVLPPAQAIQLLAKLASSERVAAELDAAEAISGLCGHLPLAIRIAGARLAARRGWPLAKLADRLRDERYRLRELQVGDQEVRSSFALSYDGQDPFQQRTFRLLGLLTAPDFPAWVAGAVADIPPPEATMVVDRLVDAQLLDVAGEDLLGQTRFHFHDLLRVFARECLRTEETPEAQQVALERVLGAYLALAERANRALSRRTFPPIHQNRARRWQPDDPEVQQQPGRDPLTWFTAERANLITAIEQAHQASLWEVTFELADKLGEYLDLRTHWTDWRHTHELAMDAARRAGDRDSEAHWLCRLGQLDAAQSPAAAFEPYLEALSIFREQGDRHGEAYALHCLAGVHRSQGRWPEAIEQDTQSLRICREIDDRHGQAQALLSLGMIRRDQGHLDDAERSLRQGSDAFDQLGDRNSHAHALRQLGELHRRQHRFDDGLMSLQRALEIFRDHGDRSGEGQALRGLADSYRDLGDPEQAHAHYDQSMEVFRTYGGTFSEAYALQGLGILHRRQGRLDEAISCFQRCLPIFHAGDRLQEARTQGSLGLALAATGDHPAAQGNWRQALATFTELGVPEAEEVRSWLRHAQ